MDLGATKYKVSLKIWENMKISQGESHILVSILIEYLKHCNYVHSGSYSSIHSSTCTPCNLSTVLGTKYTIVNSQSNVLHTSQLSLGSVELTDFYNQNCSVAIFIYLWLQHKKLIHSQWLKRMLHFYYVTISVGQEYGYIIAGPSGQDLTRLQPSYQLGCILISSVRWGGTNFQANSGCCQLFCPCSCRTKELAIYWLSDGGYLQLQKLPAIPKICLQFLRAGCSSQRLPAVPRCWLQFLAIWLFKYVFNLSRQEGESLESGQ